MHLQRRIGRVLFTTVAVIAVAGSSLTVVAATAGAAGAAGGNGSPSADTKGNASGKLSQRLAALATPEVQAMDAQAQSQTLGVADTGAGSLMTRPGGKLVVRARLTDTSTATLHDLEAAGATVTAVAADTPEVNAVIAEANLAQLQAVPGLLSVIEELTPEVHAPGGSPGGGGVATNVVCATNPTGLKSEGDAMLNAATARTTFSVDGTGVRVGVLSDSFNNLGGAAADVTAAELPGAANPCGYTTPVTVQAEYGAGTGEDEGRAMAQIVHDLAPGSPITFATAFNGEVDFSNQIRNLATNGAKVIVDDITYYDEPMYQDGVVAKAVDDVTAAGVSYFSSAANSTAFVGGKDISSYEASGGYRPTPCPTGVFASTLDCHDFDPSGGVANGDTITVVNGGGIKLSLGWNEPQKGVTTDYDIYLIDQSTGTVVAQSINSNLSTQTAFEFISYQNLSGVTKNYRMVVARYRGANAPRFKVIFHRPSGWTAVQFNTTTGADIIGPTIFGHNASLAGGSIAAIPYDNANTIETFSSRGPATYCFGPVVGVTAAAPLPSCISKPVDVAATDGTINSFFPPPCGPCRFYGTSAAAPHAAAVAALQTQAKPCTDPSEVLATQRAGAVALAGFTQADMGAGRIDAVAAINQMKTCNGTRFHAVTPFRAEDSRPGGTGFAGAIQQGTFKDLTVAPLGAVPATATALVMNVTVTGGTSGSYLTVFPKGNQPPTAANLNFGPGDTIPNAVTTKIGVGGKISFYNAYGSVDVVADVVGYFDNGVGPGDLFNGITPARMVDSRVGTGMPGALGPGATSDVLFAGVGTVPAAATAVVMNVTVTGGTQASYLQTYPTGAAQPVTANLLFGAGQTVPNLVVVGLGTGVGNAGKVRFYNQQGTVHVIADVVGYFSAAGGNKFHSLPPKRFIDSRDGTGGYATQWPSNTSRQVTVAGVSGISALANGIIMNTTVTAPSLASFLTVYPDLVANPGTANLLFGSGQTVPNLVFTKLGTNGKIQIYNQQGSVDVIADAAGYFAVA